ncbi:class I SAM-dependent methyltransferase [Allocoleopsis sp.]|uniref:class I SAM-dependent methyltransferase n=1 Tax=Allocoleopsis sp. TaxID=3088169 RepID=UPI002FCFF2F5
MSLSNFLSLLRCPQSGEPLQLKEGKIVNLSGQYCYGISASDIPLFGEQVCSPDARIQQQHYEAVAKAYLQNLSYPHTQEYMNYLDLALLSATGDTHLGTVAEICCGRGEAFILLKERIERGVGVDISLSMLENAQITLPNENLLFVQGDATQLPLQSEAFDSVFMLGGIHHVRDRQKLFSEIFRILKPGGYFVFREPLSDFILWRWLRAIIYRLSPALDHETERPLLYSETVPLLLDVGFCLSQWRSYGFLGFCLFMNSDVLVFNRLLRFVPGIRSLTRLVTQFDDWAVRLPGFQNAGLQVISRASKNA